MCVDLQTPLSEQLRQWILTSDISIYWLAERTRLKDTNISNWLKGRQKGLNSRSFDKVLRACVEKGFAIHIDPQTVTPAPPVPTMYA